MNKRITLLHLFLLIAICFKAQNGITSYSCTLYGYNASNFTPRTSFAIDNNGVKWIGLRPVGSTPNFELIRFNGSTWDSLPHVPSKKVNALAVDVANNLWIGTDSGLVMYNGSSYTIYNTGNSSIISNTVNCLAVGNGNIYIGTNGGLSVFNGTNFNNYNHALNGLSHDTINCITYESPSAIWLGNIGGLEKFYGSGFSYYFNLGGLGSDKVNCVYVDQQGNKWLGTETKGVIKFDNLNFKTMQQLFGPTAIVGAIWPSKTYSICKGPNGGVAFTGLWLNVNTYISQGLIEILNGIPSVFRGVGIYSTTGNFMYSIFQYDNSSGKIFYVHNRYPLTRVFTYSFDKSQYNYPQNITQSNSDYLDINNVSALITSNDDMGWDGGSTKYFVPKVKQTSPLKVASLWIGGYHNGSLRLGAMTYRQNGIDFWPGPLDTIQDTIDVNTQNAFNRVWKINRYDIANFIYNWNAGNIQNGSFIPHPNILSWPAHGPGAYSKRLAPFVDINGDGLYNPLQDGDYPLVKGDQMIWWVYNDKGNKHSESGGVPMGIEVQASAYAFVCPGIADSNKVLNNTTFYHYSIINRSQDIFDSCIISNWMDTDLGNYQDDYIGCDVMNNFGFVMNGDSYDEDNIFGPGYHDYLGIFSVNLLNGPLAEAGDGIDNNNNGTIDEPNERNLLDYFSYYTNTGDPMTGNPGPNSPLQYYNFMYGKWKNGVPMTYGGNGTSSIPPICHHLFPGNSDPYGISMGGSISNPITPPGSFGTTGWTQQQANVVKNDMRFLTGCGPFKMIPGGTYQYDCAFIFSQDSLNCYGDTIIGPTCTLPRATQDNIRVKRWFDNNSFPSCLSLAGVGVKEMNTPNWDVKVYPNPANETLFVEAGNAQKVTVEIFDVVGNLISGATFLNDHTYISLPLSDMKPGSYMVRLRSEKGTVSKKFMKM